MPHSTLPFGLRVWHVPAPWTFSLRPGTRLLSRHRVGLLTILFTDIVGSVELKRHLGDLNAVLNIQRHHALVREILRAFPEGEEVETAGDSFLLVFAKPSDAVKFALTLQARLRALGDESAVAIRDRIGIHLGEVLIADDNAAAQKSLFGTQVDTAARVMSLAGAGQILVTRAVFDNARQVLKGRDLAGVGELLWMNHGPYLLKGVDGALDICEAGEVGLAPLQPPADSDKASRQVSADGEPVLGWRPAVGQVIPKTQWELTEKLGEGGFGEVWLARHQTLKDTRVFKFCFRADRVRSLKREVTLFRLLREHVGEHPHIVRLMDIYFEEPPYYLEMEHIPGRDLATWLKEQGGLGNIPMAMRLEIVAQVADALQAAHDCGIIHRDVKPSNILISSSPSPPPGERAGVRGSPTAQISVKLTDFGIGQIVSDEALGEITKAGFTQTLLGSTTGSYSGTRLYMAPELLTGQKATPRSDIYSLGVVLYQLTVGDLGRPLTIDWARQVTDPHLREDLEQCFAGDPTERFPSASLLAQRLRSLDARRAEAERERAKQMEEIHAEERKKLVRFAAIVACVVVAVIGFAAYALNQSRLAKLRAEEVERAKKSESSQLEKTTGLEREIAKLQAEQYERAKQDANRIREAPGAFTVTTTPVTATVQLTVDGELRSREKTPATFSGLKPGKHDLRIVFSDKEWLDTNIVVIGGETRLLTVTRPLRPEGSLAFTGQAIGAQYEIMALDAKLPPLIGKATASPLTGLPAGRYRVVLRNEGFEDIVHTNIVVRDDLMVSLPPANWWKPRTTPPPPSVMVGGITVTTIPDGAAVEAVIEDAIVKKLSPATFGGLKPGKYELNILLAEHDRLNTNVTIKAGSTNALVASLRRSPIPPGLLTVTAKPDTVEFRVLDSSGKEVDKGRAGGGPRPLPPGEYQVVFKQSWGSYLTASATKPAKVVSGSSAGSVHHAFDEGTVRITSTPPGAQIKLGGTNTLGQTATTKPLELPLPVGSHTLVASLGNLPLKTKTLAVTSNAAQALQFDFMGHAAISSSPPGAEVWVDGLRQPAPSSESHELLEGTHEIELRLTGHAPLKTNVVITAGLVNRTLENRKLTPFFQPPAANAARWTNTLGMGFARVPVPKGNVLFCVHEARVQDFAIFAKEGQLIWQPESGPPAGPQGPTHPAVNVSWQAATDFCAWLTAREQAEGRLTSGQRYRLPTDEEWSAAAGLAPEAGATPAKRAESSPKYQGPWGLFTAQTTFTPPRNAGNYGAKALTDDYAGTAPVGKFAANRFGLFDLGGNAEEWCSDLFGAAAGVHVLRGGSWKTEPLKPPYQMHPFTSGTRNAGVIPTDTVGFRPVLDLGN